MEYGGRFRRAFFGGFRKKDVLKCFDEFSAEKADEINDLNQQLEEVRKQLSEKESALAEAEEAQTRTASEKEELEQKLTACETELQQQREFAQAAKEAREKAEAESKASLQLLKERDVKIAFLTDKSQALAQKLEESERKGKKYDDLSVEIGEMMLEAKHSAELIIRQAQERSAQMAAETGHEVDRLSADLTLFLQQLNHIKATMHSLTDGVDTRIQSLEASISTTQASISAFRQDIGETKENKKTAAAVDSKKAEPNRAETDRAAQKRDVRPSDRTEETETPNRVSKTINRLIELIGRD